jgi:3-hydroxyisobutyrate dehydrogenase-like beta-hydroxyacid dehydrogenase
VNLAFLGLGKMGTPIARHLSHCGEDLTVWTRTASHADPLREHGAKLAATASEAVRAADVVFSMFLDDAACESVFFESKLFDALHRGAIHVCLSTLSVAISRRLTSEHTARGQHFIAAPVFGRPHVAEAAKLWIAVGGAKEPVERVRRLLESFSRGITVVSEHPWSAHALKLGGNFLITAMIAALTESFIFAEALEIDPEVFLQTANGALFQSPFYELYGKIMLHPPETPGATMAVGEKDLRLFRDAAHAGQVSTPLADLFMAKFHRAFEAGMKDADWAGGYYRLERGLETPAQ